jgi:hypothetical protein
LVASSTVSASAARLRNRVRVTGSASVLIDIAERSVDVSSRWARSATAVPVTSEPVPPGCRKPDAAAPETSEEPGGRGLAAAAVAAVGTTHTGTPPRASTIPGRRVRSTPR